MNIWFASGNAHKKDELSAVLKTHRCNYNLLIPKDAGIDFNPDETGKSFVENALLKANELYRILNNKNDVIIADDSGISVDALEGRPGIFSARYGGNINSTERNKLLLEELGANVDRSARFTCSLVLLFNPNRFFVSQETLEGKIVQSMEEAAGTGGFGYYPVLYIPALGRTVAELSDDEKNTVSHRGKAAKVIAGILRELNTWQSLI